MKEKLEEIKREIESAVLGDATSTENFRLKFLSKKGLLGQLFEDFKLVAPELKKEMGRDLNIVKNLGQQKWEEAKAAHGDSDSSENKKSIDLSLPGEKIKLGSRHPLTLVKNEICEIFKGIGFTVSYGPEIEDDRHNFVAILAGYKDEMDELFKVNSGLRSRIPLEIHFPDYSLNELMEILIIC